jgi:hypothetical protein
MTLLFKAPLLGCILATASAVAAPERPEGMDFIRAQCEALIAPLHPDVLRDLNIPIGRGIDLHSGEMRSHRTQWAWLDAKRGEKAATLERLSKVQQARLEEITLQWQGAVCAFLRPSIVAKLNLTPEQSRRIESIFTLYREGLTNAGLYAERFGRKDGIHEANLNKAADTLAEAVLTVEQRLRWNDLQGKRLEPTPTNWRTALPYIK